jgi:hypothetical protein
MQIHIYSIQPGLIPRGDVADYREIDGALKIDVAKMDDWRHEACIALHELVESLLARQRGIRIQEIDEWDAAHELKGDHPGAPYHREHVFAENLERLFAQELGVNWEEYESLIDQMAGSTS